MRVDCEVISDLRPSSGRVSVCTPVYALPIRACVRVHDDRCMHTWAKDEHGFAGGTVRVEDEIPFSIHLHVHVYMYSFAMCNNF